MKICIKNNIEILLCAFVALIIFFTDFQFSLWEIQRPQDYIYIKHTIFTDR